ASTVQRSNVSTSLQPHLNSAIVLLVRAGRIGRRARVGAAGCDELVLDEIFFHLITADVREHLVVDLDAGRQRLAALGFHFPAESRVLDNVFFGVGKIVFGEHGANAGAPAAGGLKVGSDLGRIHGG